MGQFSISYYYFEYWEKTFPPKLRHSTSILLGLCNLQARVWDSVYNNLRFCFRSCVLLMSLPSMLDYHIDGSLSLRELRIFVEGNITLLYERVTKETTNPKKQTKLVFLFRICSFYTYMFLYPDGDPVVFQ